MDAEKLLLQIATIHSGDAGRIAREFKRCEDVRRRVQACEMKISAAIEAHKQVLASRDSELRLIRSECPHYATTHHGDPSGGNDRHRECDVCGAVWRD